MPLCMELVFFRSIPDLQQQIKLFLYVDTITVTTYYGKFIGIIAHGKDLSTQIPISTRLFFSYSGITAENLKKSLFGARPLPKIYQNNRI